MQRSSSDWQGIRGSEYAKNLLSTYGLLSVLLYTKVKKYKVFPLGIHRELFVSLIDYYGKSMQGKEKEQLESGFKDLIKIFPSSITLLELLKKHKKTVKGMLFFKLSIDILENYYKATESPTYEKLRKEIFPLAIEFYSELPSNTIISLNHKIRINIKTSKLLIRQ